MVDCPTCGKGHDSERAMKIHHAKKHGESIAGREINCDECGSKFKKTPCLIERDKHHYCSKQCRLAGQSRTKEGLVCDIQSLADELGKTPTRDDIRGKTGFDLKTVKNHFGSWNDALQAAGFEINEVWRLSKSERKIRYYGPNWRRQRENARQRDGYACVRCGYSNRQSVQERGRALPVHHIEWDESASYKHRNRLENLITLCHPCHNIVESWPVVPDMQMV